jgi:hypothetical protein
MPENPIVIVSRRVRARGLFGVALALVLAACSAGGAGVTDAPATPAAASTPTAIPCPSSAISAADLSTLARRGPADSVWVGMNIDWGAETVADVTSRLGEPPATVVSFVAFPLAPADVENLDAAALQARAARAVLVVTLEPWGSLSTVAARAATDLANRLTGYGADGVPTIVRFAHEMNGSWYPWGQDPAAYIATFRLVADVVHASAPTAGMLWAPNQGAGYPYAGGRYEAQPGSTAARLLDTDGDGSLDAGDDPYAPYWPGDAYVDWVGMSLYHWGAAYPWGENEVPAAGTFAGMITGSPPGGGDPTPDFYAGYAERYDKPLAIVESAAFYRPGGGGAPESAIKSAWLAEVFSAEGRSRFPLLRLINWFEWRKYEAEVDAIVDWRIAADPGLRARFLSAMTGGYHLGPAVPGAEPTPGCPAP